LGGAIQLVANGTIHASPNTLVDARGCPGHGSGSSSGGGGGGGAGGSILVEGKQTSLNGGSTFIVTGSGGGGGGAGSTDGMLAIGGGAGASNGGTGGNGATGNFGSCPFDCPVAGYRGGGGFSWAGGGGGAVGRIRVNALSGMIYYAAATQFWPNSDVPMTTSTFGQINVQ
jgi:hypothetical protein